jgi:hypothetical protein
MMSDLSNDKLRKYLRELIEDELEDLDEMSTTGGVAGFATPYAFQGKSPANKRKRRETASQAGYTVVKSDEEDRGMVSEAKTVEFRLPISGQGSRTGGGHYGETTLSRLSWGNNVVTGTATTKGNDDDLWNDTRELIARLGWQVDEPEFLGEAVKKGDRVMVRAGWGFNAVRGGAQVFKRAKTPVHGTVGDVVGSKVQVRLDPESRLGTGFEDYIVATQDALVTEGGDPYYAWRNDNTMTERQKIGKAIQEINRQLVEMHKVVKRSSRLKTEMGVANSDLWKRTNKALMKIESRMHKIAQQVRNMRG